MLTLDVSMKNPLSRQSLVVLIFPILGDFLIFMETSENRVMIISALTKHEYKLILLDFYQVHEEFVVGEITRKMGGHLRDLLCGEILNLVYSVKLLVSASASPLLANPSLISAPTTHAQGDNVS